MTVVTRINMLSGKARLATLPVVMVQHEELEGPMAYGNEGWKLWEHLSFGPDDIRIRKTGSDAFYRTELNSILRNRGVDHLMVCGMQSEFCVDSTVRVALSLGYPVTLIADGHTTLDNGVLSAAQISAHHNATLANLDSYGPRVTVASSELAWATNA